MAVENLESGERRWSSAEYSERRWISAKYVEHVHKAVWNGESSQALLSAGAQVLAIENKQKQICKCVGKNLKIMKC